MHVLQSQHSFYKCSKVLQDLQLGILLPEELVGQFQELRAAVEETILELLRREKTSKDHKGCLRIPELASVYHQGCVKQGQAW